MSRRLTEYFFFLGGGDFLIYFFTLIMCLGQLQKGGQNSKVILKVVTNEKGEAVGEVLTIIC